MRKAIDWEKGLSNALAKSLETGGSRGASGTKVNFPNNGGDFSGTTHSLRVTTAPAVVTRTPAVTTGNQSGFQHVVVSGSSETQHLQPFSATVTTGTTVTADIADAIAERAAILEFDAGIPRAWAEGYARLEAVSPAGFSEADWRRLVQDAAVFLDQWLQEAVRAGWKAEDVMDVRSTPERSPFKIGLAQLIRGGNVIRITDCSAAMRAHDGIGCVYTRRLNDRGIYAWYFDRFLERL